MNATKRTRGDEGYAIIFLALSLIILMAFVAIVVDIGGVYAVRRDDQNAADVAALAGVHEIRIANKVAKEAAIVSTVKEQAHVALGHSLTAAQWDSCPAGGDGVGQDPGVLTNQIAAASCISYNAARVRVRIPDQYWETTFGAVIGQDDILHSAFAIAGLDPEGFGGVLPFAVTGASAEGGLGCLKSNSAGQASALCDPSSGNFGFLDFSHFGPTFGDPSFGTTQSCGSGDTQVRIEENAAMGVDHELSLAGTVYVTPLADTDACPAGLPAPDAANTQTGNYSNEITNGIFECTDVASGACPNGDGLFSDGDPARLLREDSRLFGTGGHRVDDVAGVDDVDDNPLWAFIPEDTGPGEPTVADFPTSCRRDQFVSSTDSYYSDITLNSNLDGDVADFLDGKSTQVQIIALLNRCFKHYLGQEWDGTPAGSLQVTDPDTGVTTGELPSGCDSGVDATCDDAVFSLNTNTAEDPELVDIQYTSRFGYVPEIAAFPSGQSEEVAFLRFRATFIQTLVIEDGGDSYNFDPGFGSGFSGFTTDSDSYKDTSSYSRVGETLVFVFPSGMLPNGLADEEAPYDLGVNLFPELVR